jgi:Domain of unknown function (DUF4145)
VLNEAREAYLFGLSRATFALCRAALEELLEEVATAREIKLRVLDLGKERKLRRLIDAIPEAILDRARKDAAHEIANWGNAALHESGALPHAWDTLAKTIWLIEWIVNRGSLRTPRTE